jgi:hypothetical protein
MEAGEVCRILERRLNSDSGSKIILELDHYRDLHRQQLAQTLPCAKARQEGLSLARLLNSDEYVLTPRDRIMLSFAVARGFWEFYGSELINSRWCSEDIWFMTRWKRDQTSSDSLELKAFVSFPFEQYPRGPEEFLEVDDLTHSYPRILSLGIILLEIGRGKNLGIPPLIANENLGEMRDSVNDAHSDASSQLVALTNDIWEMCKYNTAFDTAVSNCLDPSKFIASSRTRKRRSKLSSKDYEYLSLEEKAVEDQKQLVYRNCAVQDRRDAIYHNIVSPLYWLAKVGNDDGKHHMSIKYRKQQHAKVRRSSTFSHDREKAEIQELCNPVQALNFHSDRRADGGAERWFEDIRTISTSVFLR